MKPNSKKILSAVMCGVIMCLLWSVYALLLLVLLPELPLKAKIAIAIAFIIPTVVLIGATAEKVRK